MRDAFQCFGRIASADGVPVVLSKQKAWRLKVRRVLFTSPRFAIQTPEHSDNLEFYATHGNPDINWYFCEDYQCRDAGGSDNNRSDDATESTQQDVNDTSPEKSVKMPNESSAFFTDKAESSERNDFSPHTQLTAPGSFASLDTGDLLLDCLG